MHIIRAALCIAVTLTLAACSQVEVRKVPEFACNKEIHFSSAASGKVFGDIAVAEFFENDRDVTASLTCRNISGSHAIKWEWQDPSGNVYAISDPVSLSTQENLYSPSATIKHGIRLKDELASTLPGDWKVKAYLDDILLTTRLFSLSKIHDLFNQVKELHPVPANENKYAVVIGIEKYLDTPAARFATRDAEVMKELFIRRFGVPEQNITMLTNDRASLGVMRNLFGNKLHALPDSSTLYVFYSGHGAPQPPARPGDEATPYLLPYDGSATNLANTALSLKDFYSDLDQLPVQNVFVFLDACFSGSTGRINTEKASISKDIKAVEFYVHDPAIASRKVVSITSSQGTQLSNSSEVERLGLFTSQLIKGLVDPNSPISKNRRVTVEELFRYLKSGVEKESRMIYGLDRVQVPSLKSGMADARLQLKIVDAQ